MGSAGSYDDTPIETIAWDLRFAQLDKELEAAAQEAK